MKRFLGILFLVVIISGCDDGDLFLEDINFDKATVATCANNDIIYKLNKKEAIEKIKYLNSTSKAYTFK